MLPDIEEKDLAQIANQIRKNVEELAIETVDSKYVTVSIGAASVVPEAGMKAVDLINAADQAMYSAKDSGKNLIKLA